MGREVSWDDVRQNRDTLLEEALGLFHQLEYVLLPDFTPPKCAGIYSLKNPDGDIIYIGESDDLCGRIKTHLTDTYFSTLRRKIGTNLLGCERLERSGKKRYFSLEDECKVNDYLERCAVAVLPVNFGRKETEKYLISEIAPLLN